MNSKKILYIQYVNPAVYPPLEHSSRILADSGWEVLFLGMRTTGVNSLVLAPHERIRVILLPKNYGGLLLKLHYLWFCLWTFFWVLFWRPNWVYASDVFSTPTALLLKIILGKKVIYHEHDSPNVSSATFFMQVCLRTRRWLAQQSDFNVLPNDERIVQFCKENNISRQKCLCVWNCPSIKEVRGPKTIATEEIFWLLFQGSIVPQRLPLTIIQALALLPAQVNLKVIGYETIGNKGYIKRLKDEALRLNVSDRVVFLGPIARHDLLNWSQTCTVGMSLMPQFSGDINMKSMTGASNKPFEYLTCGLPLLVTDLPEWRKVFVESGLAKSCNPDDPDSIAEVINWYLEHPKETLAMGEIGRQKILSEWNYETKFKSVLEKLS